MSRIRHPGKNRKELENKTSSPRPLTQRALKSIFDILRPHIADTTVLDLFCGTGRFTVTALAEGARHSTMVEKNRKTLAEFSAEFPKLRPQVSLLSDDVFTFLGRNTETFDIVFADPPFPFWTEDFAENLLNLIPRAMHSGSIFLVQSPKRVVLSPQNLSLWKMKVIGDSSFWYFHEK